MSAEDTPKRFRRHSEYVKPPTKAQQAKIDKARKWRRDATILEDDPVINREITLATLAHPTKTPTEIARAMRAGKGPLTRGGKPIERDLIVRKITKTKRELAAMGPRLIEILRDSIEGAFADGEFDTAAKHALGTLRLINHKDETGVVHKVVDQDEGPRAAAGVVVHIGLPMVGKPERPVITVQKADSHDSEVPRP